MFKLLLLAVAVWLLLTIVKRYRHSLDKPKQPPAIPEDMVQCAACGMHLPRSEGVVVDQQTYCSVEHSKPS